MEEQKKYTNGEITVIWQPALCTHSCHCWKGLIKVFNPRERPWVNMSGGTTEEIVAQVNDCPSGALSWVKNSELSAAAENPAAEENKPVVITVTTNGSLKVEGQVVIRDESGNVVKEGDKLFLCRCGHSAKKPFCDGSHKKAGFVG